MVPRFLMVVPHMFKCETHAATWNTTREGFLFKMHSFHVLPEVWFLHIGIELNYTLGISNHIIISIWSLLQYIKLDRSRTLEIIFQLFSNFQTSYYHYTDNLSCLQQNKLNRDSLLTKMPYRWEGVYTILEAAFYPLGWRPGFMCK